MAINTVPSSFTSNTEEDCDNETTESGKEATNDVSDKSDQDPATTNKSDAENTIWILDKEEEDDYDPVIYSGKKKRQLLMT